MQNDEKLNHSEGRNNLKNQNDIEEQIHVEVEEKEMKCDKGGWGYCVCFGTVITFIAGIGHVNSFGLIYNDFIIETKSSAKSLTTAHGTFAIMLAFGGIALNILRKKLSLRFGGLIGAVLFTTGSFLTVNIFNMDQLLVTFGILQGLGFGMMVPVCYATLNHFFVKKRTMIMSAIKAVQGIILMGYPQLIKLFTNFYGFRDTLILLSAISLHTIAGMLIMTPTEAKTRAANTKYTRNRKELENLVAPRDSNNMEKFKDMSRKNKGIGFQILSILNLKVLKDPVYCNICFGQSFVNFSDLTFFILQPMLLFQYGYDRDQVATCISICSGADLFGRCVMIGISASVHVNTRALFYFSAFATFVARIVILQLRQFIWVATGTAVLGLLRAWLHIASPLVISNHVSHEDFPGAYALATLAAGVVNILISPLIGFLKDSYQDYTPAFYALAACCSPCLLMWPLEYAFRSKLN